MADAKNNFDVRYVQRGEQHSAAFRRQQAEARLEPGTDYSMPRNQHADQSLDFSGVFRASAHVPIPSDNRGYVMLQKMGWAGSGLGRNLTGACIIQNVLQCAVARLRTSCACSIAPKTAGHHCEPVVQPLTAVPNVSQPCTHCVYTPCLGAPRRPPRLTITAPRCCPHRPHRARRP